MSKNGKIEGACKIATLQEARRFLRNLQASVEPERFQAAVPVG
jgi:hypothetical protein